MPVTVKHTFVSAKLDGPDPSFVRPSNWNADHTISGGGLMLPGTIIDFVGTSWPAYMLECYGQSVPAATYPLLFSSMVKQASVTLSLGNPGVVNWAAHGLVAYNIVRFKTTSKLPDGMTADTDYMVNPVGLTANNFSITTNVGVPVNFSGAQSGIQTAINAQYGVSTDLSTFTIPDLRSRVIAGFDLMGGVASGRLTGTITGGVHGSVLGHVGGEQAHMQTVNEMAVHNHTVTAGTVAVSVTVADGGNHYHLLAGPMDAGGHHAHNQQGRQYGGTYGGAGTHTHTVYDRGSYFEQVASISAPQSGSRTIVQPSWEGSGSGVAIVTDAGNSPHEHSVYVDIGGATDAQGSHTHGTASMYANWAGTHTHAASGSVSLASITINNNGGNEVANVVQPTIILRKLIFVG